MCGDGGHEGEGGSDTRETRCPVPCCARNVMRCPIESTHVHPPLQAACSFCPDGHTVGDDGACAKCAAGTYSRGGKLCAKCNTSTYSEEGAVACTSCGSFSYVVADGNAHSVRDRILLVHVM